MLHAATSHGPRSVLVRIQPIAARLGLEDISKKALDAYDPIAARCCALAGRNVRLMLAPLQYEQRMLSWLRRGLGTGAGLLLGFLWISADAQAQGTAECLSVHRAGQEQRLAGELDAARASFEQCVAVTCPEPIRKDCAAWLDEVKAAPSVTVSVQTMTGQSVRDAQLEIDGEPHHGDPLQAIVLEPGDHTIRVQANGYQANTSEISLAAGERQRLVVVQLQPSAEERVEGRGIPVATYVLGGVALAGLSTFAGFGIAGYLQLKDMESRCDGQCSEDEISSGKRKYVIADVGAAVGIAAAVAAVVVYFVDAQSESESQTPVASTRLDAIYLPGLGGHLGVNGRF